MSPPPKQLVLAASSAEAGVAAWDLRTGAEDIRLRPCASRLRALASVADRFLAAAQAPPARGNSGIVHFYHWDKPQVAVKSFPAEPIRALIADAEGSYLIGGGGNGNIFLWEVTGGELLYTWHAHYRAVRCLALYDYLLVSGSEDGSIRVWDLITVLDEQSRLDANTSYLHNLSQHALPVTDIACFLGGIAVSSSEDRTCKIWSISEGRMLRSVSFPVIIDSVALDPRSHIFYAGGRDGKIYVTAMGVDVISHGSDESPILGALDDHSKAVTSLATSIDGLLLVSGSEDGNVRVWDTRSQQVTRKFKHSQGPVTNVLIVTPKRVNLPPLQPLSKVCSASGVVEPRAVILPRPENDVPIAGNLSSIFLERCLDELQHGGSSRLFDSGSSTQYGAPNQQGTKWRSRYLELQDLFAHEVLDQMSSSRDT
ncbi:protein ROOT INITIATION DEFECTIVE 3-like isoform X2 [Phragmites australis]|uniref:protein ROOT INITIATION DEFECTIVE 3-like isoform X2 n=1 Tax=Phragmites australis TaxID=29695 RepID=UPI002D79AB09|nr:protein ROOT INITIATION DEFECTIVE 3-like isoform X2 [Phragmites australis]